MSYTPDLHLHTTASDGIFAPAQVVFKAQNENVNCLAITDHDTMSGIQEAREQAEALNITLIPAVEISTRENNRDVHILGYGVNPESERLQDLFREIRDERRNRFRAIGKRLEELHLPIPTEEILAQTGESVGRPHAARAMIKAGYVQDIAEAFDKYLEKGRPAYVKRKEHNPSEVIALLRQENAVPVLAHPTLLRLSAEMFLPLLRQWIDSGLMGLEVYHPANRSDYRSLEKTALNHRLLITGGSDFHDLKFTRHGMIGETAKEWRNAAEDVEKLLEAIRK